MDVESAGINAVASGSGSRMLRVPEAVYKDRVPPVNDYRPAHAESSCPLIIDNGAALSQLVSLHAEASSLTAAPSPSGSSQLRAGWGDEAAPRLIADQVVARYRDRKTNRTHLLVGADTEVDATSRSSAKPVFEGDVLTNFENMVRAHSRSGFEAR